MKYGQMITLALALMPIAALPLRAQDNSFALPHVLEKIDALIGTPAPSGLSPADAKQYAAETTWLRSARTRISSIAVKGGQTLPPTSPRRAQEPSPAVSKAVETLRQTLVREGAKFDAMTGASKWRHDVAMSAIRNMKA